MGQTVVDNASRANETIQLGGPLRVNAGSAATGFSIADPSDATKLMIFDLSGLTTNTTTTFAPSAGGAEVTETGTQTLSNKTLLDTSTTLANTSAPTKKGQFLMSGVTAGQTRILTWPNFDGTIATLAGNENLTNKTLTSPSLSGTMSGGTVAPTTLTVPASTSLTTPAIAGATLTGTITRASQSFFISTAGAKVGATAGWAVNAADDVALATVPASQTAATLVIPISGLHIGDVITSFSLVGNLTSAANHVTMDASLRKATAGAAAPTDALIGSMTQLDVVTNTAMSAANTTKGSLAYTVLVTDNVYMLLTVTTAASTTATLQGIVLTVTQN